MSSRRVVITGLGIVSPVGSTIDSAWRNVLEGKSGIVPITRFDASAFPVRFHGAVADFDAEKYLPAKRLRNMDPFMHYGYAAAADAIKDSGIVVTPENAARIGVAMGAAGSAVALETADIALMGDDLLKLPHAIALAKRTVSNMRQNIAVALGTVALLVAGVLFGGVTMSVGMLVHEASVLLVIVNAMRLLRRVPGSSGAARRRPGSARLTTLDAAR